MLIELARTMLLSGPTKVRLGDVATCVKGLSYKGNGLVEDSSLGLPMINLANFGTGGWLNAQKLKFYKGEYKERHLLQSGDLVVANTDLTQQRVIIGRPALVPPNIGRSIFTHHVTAIRPIDDKKLNLPIWAQLNSPAFRERAEGFATGTTVAGMPVEALLDFEISIPASSLIEEAKELLVRVWAAESENISLSSLRDFLLPELLSGRLRVKDAESMVENV
jgi:type I restriction enzyme S subunit